MTAGNSDRIKDHLWATLAANALHPVQVEIVEAMYWIDQPLSVADLAEIVDPTFPPHLVHHLRRLTRLNAIKPEERPTPRNAATIRFRLTTERSADER